MHETTTLLLVTLPNIHRFTDKLSDKPFLIWLVTTPPHLKYYTYTTLQFVDNGFFC